MEERIRLRRPLDLPDVWPVGYMLEAFQEIGMFRISEGGRTPFTWGDVRDYAEVSGTIGDSWELMALMRMSSSYLTGVEEGANIWSIPPAKRE